MKRVIFGIVTMAALVLILTPTPAHATAVIDFSGSGLGGNLIISGGNASGTFSITSLTVSGAPQGNGNYSVSGTLTFNTLANNISLTGSVAGLGVPTTTLLTGSFNSFSVNAGAVLGIVSGGGPDTKSALLLAALGLPANTAFQFFGFDISANTSGTGSPYTSTYSVDLANTQVVPEPGTLALCGSGLLTLAGVMRRKLLRA
jgi:hypothetical protein